MIGVFRKYPIQKAFVSIRRGHLQSIRSDETYPVEKVPQLPVSLTQN